MLGGAHTTRNAPYTIMVITTNGTRCQKFMVFGNEHIYNVDHFTDFCRSTLQ